MLDFIFGFLFGRYSQFSETNEDEDRFGSDYIPKFSLRANEELTRLVEPDYDPIYVQLIEHVETEKIVFGRKMRDDAIDSRLCYGVVDVTSGIDDLQYEYPNAILQNELEPIWLNVVLDGRVLAFYKDKVKYDDAFDAIPCFDEVEFSRIMREARKYYEQYRLVFFRRINRNEIIGF